MTTPKSKAGVTSPRILSDVRELGSRFEQLLSKLVNHFRCTVGGYTQTRYLKLKVGFKLSVLVDLAVNKS